MGQNVPKFPSAVTPEMENPIVDIEFRVWFAPGAQLGSHQYRVARTETDMIEDTTVTGEQIKIPTQIRKVWSDWKETMPRPDEGKMKPHIDAI